MSATSNSFGLRSQYFANQYAQNRIIRDLEIGLPALKGVKDIMDVVRQETNYLPRYPNEPQEFYELRVARTYLTNWFMRAITSDSGKILANNVMVSVNGKPNDEMPDPYREWTRDMTLDGSNLTMVTQDILQGAMKKGVSLCLIDYNNDSRRPYTRIIDIDSVVNFKSDPRTGKLSYLKFYFDYVTSGEDSTDLVSAEFEVWPTKWQITVTGEENPVESGEIIRYKNGSTRITDQIPVVAFYTNKKGILRATSPYQTLAELTIEHFQVYSDIKNMMFYALTPILVAKNVPVDFTVEMLASYMMIKMPETGANTPELDWVQVDSGALESGKTQLEGIEKRIATFTIDNSALRPGTLTATQSSLESQGSNAALRSFAVALSEAVKEILSMMASYDLREDDDIKGYIAPEFNSAESATEMRTLLEMRRNLDISREAIVDAAIQRKLLPPDFSATDNWDQLEEEVKRTTENEVALEKLKGNMNSAAQVSEGLLAGSGEEEITDQPRDA